ncbi:MAG: hypothetical protein ACKPBB_10915 [Sphaerospermopsis kisseleviana]
MKYLSSNSQAITPYNSTTLVYDAEVVELYPEEMAEPDYFKCPTDQDIAQAEQELESDRKLTYWDWLKNVLG